MLTTAKWVALIWALVNVGLSFQSTMRADAPLAARFAVGFLPALFVLFPGAIARFLPYQQMAAFARDFNEKQPPGAIAMFGFAVLGATTLALLL